MDIYVQNQNGELTFFQLLLSLNTYVVLAAHFIHIKRVRGECFEAIDFILKPLTESLQRFPSLNVCGALLQNLVSVNIAMHTASNAHLKG